MSELNEEELIRRWSHIWQEVMVDSPIVDANRSRVVGFRNGCLFVEVDDARVYRQLTDEGHAIIFLKTMQHAAESIAHSETGLKQLFRIHVRLNKRDRNAPLKSQP